MNWFTEFLCRRLGCCTSTGAPDALGVSFFNPGPAGSGEIVLGVNNMVSMRDGQRFGASVTPTYKGQPAKLDGAPTWTASDAAALDVVVSEDGLSALVSSKGLVGVFQVTIKADADLDAGEVRELNAVIDVEVLAGEADALGVTTTAPEDIPAGPPVEQVSRRRG